MSKNIWLLSLLISISFSIKAQKQIPRLDQLDVQHYHFALDLSDSSNTIVGEAQLSIKFLQPLSEFYLDLVGLDESTNKGMLVQISIRNL